MQAVSDEKRHDAHPLLLRPTAKAKQRGVAPLVVRGRFRRKCGARLLGDDCAQHREGGHGADPSRQSREPVVVESEDGELRPGVRLWQSRELVIIQQPATAARA